MNQQEASEGRILATEVLFPDIISDHGNDGSIDLFEDGNFSIEEFSFPTQTNEETRDLIVYGNDDKSTAAEEEEEWRLSIPQPTPFHENDISYDTDRPAVFNQKVVTALDLKEIASYDPVLFRDKDCVDILASFLSGKEEENQEESLCSCNDGNIMNVPHMDETIQYGTGTNNDVSSSSNITINYCNKKDGSSSSSSSSSPLYSSLPSSTTSEVASSLFPDMQMSNTQHQDLSLMLPQDTALPGLIVAKSKIAAHIDAQKELARETERNQNGIVPQQNVGVTVGADVLVNHGDEGNAIPVVASSSSSLSYSAVNVMVENNQFTTINNDFHNHDHFLLDEVANDVSPPRPGSRVDSWMSKYQELCHFYRTHGHTLVPLNYEENIPLAQWVKRQRHQYQRKIRGEHSTLTDDREEALNRVRFVWDAYSIIWEQRWLELLEFKAIHGHCNVPTGYPENPKLSIWVKGLRRQARMLKRNPSPIDIERVNRLTRIGFNWNPSNR